MFFNIVTLTNHAAIQRSSSHKSSFDNNYYSFKNHVETGTSTRSTKTHLDRKKESPTTRRRRHICSHVIIMNTHLTPNTHSHKPRATRTSLQNIHVKPARDLTTTSVSTIFDLNSTKPSILSSRSASRKLKEIERAQGAEHFHRGALAFLLFSNISWFLKCNTDF